MQCIRRTRRVFSSLVTTLFPAALRFSRGGYWSIGRARNTLRATWTVDFRRRRFSKWTLHAVYERETEQSVGSRGGMWTRARWRQESDERVAVDFSWVSLPPPALRSAAFQGVRLSKKKTIDHNLRVYIRIITENRKKNVGRAATAAGCSNRLMVK